MKKSASRGAVSGLGFSCLALLATTTGLGCLGGPGDPSTERPDTLVAPLSVSPVAQHGALHVAGSHLEDEHGAVVQLRGMSMFWSQWSGQLWNEGVVGTLADDWHASVVRAAMGVENGGYLDNPDAEKTRVKTVVDAAIARGIYVIIDWHDHHATQHTWQSKQFFTEMAQTYGHTPNVIFELYNEPVDVSWGQVKGYAEEVLGAIRGAGANNVVVVGTPTWSQDVDVAADDPITSSGNVAYTLHFYAGSHKQTLRDKASYAISRGLPLFVTEWGTCDASGNGGIDLGESQTWIDFLDQHQLSFANWSLFDKPESASALVPGAGTWGGWPDSALTESGRFAKQKILEGASSAPGPGAPGGGGAGSLSGRISLRSAADDQFVCADDYGNAALIANRAVAQGWEQFDVLQNDDGSVSFRAVANGRLVSAEDAGWSPLRADRDAVGDWEKFFASKNADGTFSLQSKVNGKFVCAENAGTSPLIANRSAVGLWEEFWITQAP